MERELKFLLSASDYEALRSFAGPSATQLEQHNHYFDSRERVLRDHAGASLRIRGEGPPWAWELTLKVGTRVDQGYFEAHEWNEALAEDQAHALVEGGAAWPWESEPLRHFERLFGQRQLVRLGSVENVRIRVPLFGDEVAELDKTRFPDGSVDYELEIETEDPRAVRGFLSERGWDFPNQSKTKFRRFLERFNP